SWPELARGCRHRVRRAREPCLRRRCCSRGAAPRRTRLCWRSPRRRPGGRSGQVAAVRSASTAWSATGRPSRARTGRAAPAGRPRRTRSPRTATRSGRVPHKRPRARRATANGEPANRAPPLAPGADRPGSGPELRLPLLELRVACGEVCLAGLLVANEVHPRAVGWIQRCLDGVQPWVTDRAGRQTRVDVRVVRSVFLDLSARRRRLLIAWNVQAVEDRAVEMECHVLTEPVPNDSGDLAEIARTAFGLSQAGDDEHMPRRGAYRRRRSCQVERRDPVIEIAYDRLEDLQRRFARYESVSVREQKPFGGLPRCPARQAKRSGQVVHEVEKVAFLQACLASQQRGYLGCPFALD